MAVATIDRSNTAFSPPPTEKISASIPEACAISGLTRASLYRLFKEKKLTPRKHGRRTLIMVSELRDYINSLPEAA